jgi:hypothetical protein
MVTPRHIGSPRDETFQALLLELRSREHLGAVGRNGGLEPLATFAVGRGDNSTAPRYQMHAQHDRIKVLMQLFDSEPSVEFPVSDVIRVHT